MTPACPDPMLLARVARGEAEGDRADVLDHASGCAACRQALLDFAPGEDALSSGGRASAQGALRKPRSWIPYAAAAGLLAGAVVLYHGGDADTPPAPDRTSAPSAASPFPARELPVVAGNSCALVFRADSEASPFSGGITLLKGAVRIEDPGEPLEIRTPGARILLERAVAVVEIPAPPSASAWLREALAAAPAGTLRVLSGTATLLRPETDPLPVREGQEADLATGALRPSAGGWSGEQAWTPGPGARELRAPPGADYVWEARISRKVAASSLSLRFSAGGRGWARPEGAPLATSGIRVHVECLGGWVRVQAGPHEMLKSPASSLTGRLEAAAPGCGFDVSGGDFEILESRWRKLP